MKDDTIVTIEPEKGAREDVKERILTSAIGVFLSQGRLGARIQHIAENAQVNKALVYYYFKNRTELYRQALRWQLQTMFEELWTELSPMDDVDHNSVALLKHFMRAHFRVVSRNRDRTRFIVGAAADEPNLVRSVVRQLADSGQPEVLRELLAAIERGVSSGQLRSINPKQLVISMLGMNMFFFVARPIAETFLDLNIEDEELFLEERLTSVLDSMLYGVIERR